MVSSQVVLCSRATAEVREFLPWTELRPGIVEASLVTRLMEQLLERLVHTAGSGRVKEALRRIEDANA